MILSEVDTGTNAKLRNHMEHNQSALDAIDNLVPDEVAEIKNGLTPPEIDDDVY